MDVVLVLAVIVAVAAVAALAWLVAQRRAEARDLARLTELLAAPGMPPARARVDTRSPEVVALAQAIDLHLDAERARALERSHAEENFREELSALSHDIRTPLAGAAGYLQLAQRASDPAASARYLERADERLTAMRALVDDLFAYARATDPSFSPERSPVEVGQVVAQVLAAHYEEFSARGWEPVVDLAEVPPVLANEEACARVVENLVVNALSHGSGAPRIRLCAGEGDVRLVVENPVSAEDAARLDTARLASRFYQGDPSRTTPGTGLGLAVARALAQAQGGSLDVSVTPGPAFRATFSLPVAAHS